MKKGELVLIKKGKEIYCAGRYEKYLGENKHLIYLGDNSSKEKQNFVVDSNYEFRIETIELSDLLTIVNETLRVINKVYDSLLTSPKGDIHWL